MLELQIIINKDIVISLCTIDEPLSILPEIDEAIQAEFLYNREEFLKRLTF